MKVVLAEEMNIIDKKNIMEIGIPGIVLMENAAKNVFLAIEKTEIVDKKIVIICGTGKNGGDGFAIARLCKDKGYFVKVFIIGDTSKISGDALTNYNILKNIKVDIS